MDPGVFYMLSILIVEDDPAIANLLHAAMSHIIVDTGAEKVSRKHCGIVYDGRHPARSRETRRCRTP